jgi:hypothetical protein
MKIEKKSTLIFQVLLIITLFVLVLASRGLGMPSQAESERESLNANLEIILFLSEKPSEKTIDPTYGAMAQQVDTADAFYAVSAFDVTKAEAVNVLVYLDKETLKMLDLEKLKQLRQKGVGFVGVGLQISELTETVGCSKPRLPDLELKYQGEKTIVSFCHDFAQAGIAEGSGQYADFFVDAPILSGIFERTMQDIAISYEK